MTKCFVLLSAFFSISALAETYQCGNYLLLTNPGSRYITLKGKDFSADRLVISSMGSGTSRTNYFRGSFVADHENVFKYIQVEVDNELLSTTEGNGEIRVSFFANEVGKAYPCHKTVAKRSSEM